MFIYSLNIINNNDYFIYSVTTSFIYSVTMTTSDNTDNYWKECYVYIFTDNNNNNLACKFSYNTHTYIIQYQYIHASIIHHNVPVCKCIQHTYKIHTYIHHTYIHTTYIIQITYFTYSTTVRTVHWSIIQVRIIYIPLQYSRHDLNLEINLILLFNSTVSYLYIIVTII